MDVSIVTFPETPVALIRHRGPPWQEHETVRRLVAWKLALGLRDPARYRTYGLHYTDPRTTPPDEHRVDFCLSVEGEVAPNDDGIEAAVIPALRCAVARDVGSRRDNQAIRFLHEEWLPRSGERLAAHPSIFHYVNVGPQVKDAEAITDVYLPLA